MTLPPGPPVPTDVGRTPAGDPVLAIPLRGGGLVATILTYGATLQDLRLADGRAVVLGSPDLAAYLGPLRYFGAIVGPVANRIAGGRFGLDGRDVVLDRNEAGRTTLHGGAAGFGERVWRLAHHAADRCTLALDHADGLGGFPGPLAVTATYRLLPPQVLEIEITGTAPAVAVFAPAFHGYWNLDGSPDILSHRLTIAADKRTPVDAALIPQGPPVDVAGTDRDYRSARPVGPDLDDNFCTGSARTGLRPVAVLQGRDLRLDVETTEPGLQVYAAARTSSGGFPGLDGRPFGLHAGVALEPQLWPDAVNRPDFPSARLDPGVPVTQVSRFRLTRV